MEARSLITDSAAEFGAALPEGGVLLALDLGTQTIGTALCDAGWRFASPGKTLPRGKFGRDREALGTLAKERRAVGVVIGLPRNMDGSEGSQATTVRAFGQRLAELGIDVVYEDERLTSWEAGERMAQAGRRVRRGTGELDSTAARLILQQYLDARYRAGRPVEESE